jgi:hypothetical protein
MMMMPFIFVGVGLLGLFLIVYLAKGLHAKGGDLGELAARLRPIDVDAFRNLIDEREEEYLRVHLPPREFRSIHRERMLAAVEYVWSASRNTSILISLGEAAKQSPDPAVVAAADKLLENALRLRLYAIQALPRMYVSMLFPSAGRAPQFIAETYDIMVRQAVVLGCLQPAKRTSAAV